MRETYKETDDSPNRQNSVLYGGKACSSPTPTSSEHSNIIQSWHGLSDISLSTVEQNTYNSRVKKTSSSQEKNCSFHGEMAGDSDKQRTMKDVKTQLEFISLPGGETSHTISLPIYKNEETKRHSNAGKSAFFGFNYINICSFLLPKHCGWYKKFLILFYRYWRRG